MNIGLRFSGSLLRAMTMVPSLEAVCSLCPLSAVVGCGVGAAEVLAAPEVAVGAGIGVAAGPPQARVTATPMTRAIATIQTGSGAVPLALLSKFLKLSITLLKLLSARCN
jgi:hypothetical protein